MPKYVFFLFFVMFQLSSNAGEQDTTVMEEEVVADSIPQYEYWRQTYYDSIPAAAPVVKVDSQEYTKMLSRYQEEEFTYAESVAQKLNFVDTILNRIAKLLNDLFPRSNRPVEKPFLYILGFMGACIFMYLIYKFLINRNKLFIQQDGEEQSEQEQVQFVEQNLMQVSIADYLQEAVKRKNYALAIRYHQLLLIQTLGRKGLIDWRYTKTNRELADEIQTLALKHDFLRCVSIFEHVWFGEFSIGAEDYARYEQIFQQFERKWS